MRIRRVETDGEGTDGRTDGTKRVEPSRAELAGKMIKGAKALTGTGVVFANKNQKEYLVEGSRRSSA